MDKNRALATLAVYSPSLFRMAWSLEHKRGKEDALGYEQARSFLEGTLQPLFESKMGIDLRQPNYHLLAASVAGGVVTLPQAFAMALQMRKAQINLAATAQNILSSHAAMDAENKRAKYFAEQQKRLQQSHDAEIYNRISAALQSRAEILNKSIDLELMTYGVPARTIEEINRAFGVGADPLAAKRMWKQAGELGKQAQDVIAKLQEQLVGNPDRLDKINKLILQKAHNYKAAVLGVHEAYKDYLRGADPFQHLGDYFEMGRIKTTDDATQKHAKKIVETGVRNPITYLWETTDQYYQDHYKRIGLTPYEAETVSDVLLRKDKMNVPPISGNIHDDLSTFLYGIPNIKKLDAALVVTATEARMKKAKESGLAEGIEDTFTNAYDTSAISGVDDLLWNAPVADDPHVQELLAVEPKTTDSLFSWYESPANYPAPERFKSDFSAVKGIVSAGSDAAKALVGAVHAMSTLVRYWKDIIKHRTTLESRAIQQELGGVYSDLVRGEPVVEEQSPIRGEVKKILSKKPSKLSSEDRDMYGEVIDTRAPLEALKELTGWK